MRCRTTCSFIALIALNFPCLAANVQAMTGSDILSEVVKRNFQETFRLAIDLKTFKGKKIVSEHSLWCVVRPEQEHPAIFVDFEEPADSRGLRFLFLLNEGQQPEAYMYLPASEKTLPLDMEEASADIGATGLTIDDIRVFAPKSKEEGTLIREEEMSGRDCYVIRVPLAEGKGERRLWVSKDQFTMVKVEQRGPDGELKRVFRVVEFFRTETGKEFPREEEIVVPEKKIRIRVRQQNAVFGIEVPDELTDPKTFGKFQWRSGPAPS
jgi:Outer membrane lipoprotein-sorting protein